MSAEIRALMGRHRVTQTALADYLGMSQSSLSERLNSRVPWDIDDLVGISTRFEVPLRELLDFEAADNRRYVNITAVTTPLYQLELFGHDSAIEAPSLELVKV